MNNQTKLNKMEVLAIPKRTPYVITNQEMLEIINSPRPVISSETQARLEIFRSQIITCPSHHPVLKRTLHLKK